MHTYWLWLALHPDLTEQEKMTLMEHFLDPEELFFADPTEKSPQLTELMKKAQANRKLDTAERILAECSKEGIQIIPRDDALYPVRLRNISDPPLVLYCRGKLPPVDALPVIAVVGTRKASAYGQNMARQLGSQIAGCGGTVVSGMALGIDGMAMSGAIASGGTVIGVMGCGPEQIYPRANRRLYEDTLRYGCILSEYPPGTPPLKWNFPRRNRIISGLSCGVLVVEAPERSGSLITAHLAAEQGRDVFVVPGNVDTPGFEGSLQLLREGAAPVSNGWAILEEYQSRFPGLIQRKTVRMPAERQNAAVCQPEIPGKTVSPPVSSDKKSIDKETPGTYIDVNSKLPDLTSDERAIVQALRPGARLVDEVIAETGLTTGKMLAAMTMLELKGILRRLSGKRIILN